MTWLTKGQHDSAFISWVGKFSNEESQEKRKLTEREIRQNSEAEVLNRNSKRRVSALDSAKSTRSLRLSEQGMNTLAGS